MKTSASGIEVIKEFEGLRLKAYLCPAGILTIGYGHTSAAGLPTVVPGKLVSESQAEEILLNDLKKYEQGVSNLVKVQLSQGEFDALVSFAYNVGVGALSRSTLLKRINSERPSDVPAEFMKWTRGGGRELPGLVRRRRAEVKLWRGLKEDAPTLITESRAKPDLPAPKKSITQSREANGAIVAGAGGAAAIVQEVLPAIRDGSDFISSLSPTALVCFVVIGAAIAIWYFRKQRLEEE